MPEKVVTLASTTSSQAELDHAASDDWRTPPYVPTEPKQEGTEPEQGKTAAESETAITEQKPETKPSRNGWEKRIDRLTARNKGIEAENAELRARLDAIERGQAAPPKEPAATAKPAQDSGPKLADFATPEEWADARLEWRRTQERQREESTAAEQETREVWDAHNNRLSEARAKYDDFDDVAKTVGDINIPQTAVLAIIEQPNSADVTYYLATHTDEAKKLAELRPLQQIAAISRISDKLTTPAAPKPKPQSQAPAPIKPVGSAATASTVDPGAMSYQDYKRYRSAGRN